MFENLVHIEERYKELTRVKATAWGDAGYVDLNEYEDVLKQIEGARELLEEEDSEMVELARRELAELEPWAERLTEQLRLMLMLMRKHPRDVANLVDVWIRRYVLLHEGKTELLAGAEWAWEEIYDLGFNPEEIWPIILETIRLAPSDWILACIAAGPLEDLIVVHAEEFIDRIEQEAETSPKFRLCLTGVWYRHKVPEHLRVRLDRCSAGPLGRL